MHLHEVWKVDVRQGHILAASTILLKSMSLRHLLSLQSLQSWFLCRAGPERWTQQIILLVLVLESTVCFREKWQEGLLPDCAQGDKVLALQASDSWKRQQSPWWSGSTAQIFIPEALSLQLFLQFHNPFNILYYIPSCLR